MQCEIVSIFHSELAYMPLQWILLCIWYFDSGGFKTVGIRYISISYRLGLLQRF